MAEKNREELVDDVIAMLDGLRVSAYSAYKATKNSALQQYELFDQRTAAYKAYEETSRWAKIQYDMYDRMTKYVEALVTGKKPEDNVESD